MATHKFFHDETERRKWQNPEEILAEIGLKSGFIFIDVGCNDGFFAIPAARITGEKGKVYGIDIDRQAINRLKKKAGEEGLKNLDLTLREAEETVLCEGCADIVFFGIDLHDFRDPARVLMNAKRMLKPGGILVDLDWKKEPMPLGPPVQIRLSEEEAAKLIESQGFKVETVKKSGLYHYLIIAKI
jgi:ubiquinone/menaquinone biosynthesis C-methylase UbiE